MRVNSKFSQNSFQQSKIIHINVRQWAFPKKRLRTFPLLKLAQVCTCTYFAQRTNIPAERFMLPATKDQCSIRISELLNSFQPWCYYLIWGRVTTCLPLLSLQMFHPLPGLIHFMMASKCQSISLIVVCVYVPTVHGLRIEFLLLMALSVAEG